MRIIITGRKVEVDDALKALINKKLSRLDKFFKDDAVAYVTLSREKIAERLELTVSNSGTLFRSEVSDKTFNNALDKSMDVIERQIRKNKTKLEKRLKDGAIKQIADAEPENEYVTVREKRFVINEMSVDEAILQMELTDHEFYIFRNLDSDELSVVYNIKNGGHGVIIPEK
ncbi:MAG: ribosome-associated translation inhibitor RaiA [Firmicutes bacterium]|nr:ribosome-associated translation inhibitor RaiA [Candidatus Colimorpha enterica]